MKIHFVLLIFFLLNTSHFALAEERSCEYFLNYATHEDGSPTNFFYPGQVLLDNAGSVFSGTFVTPDQAWGVPGLARTVTMTIDTDLPISQQNGNTVSVEVVDNHFSPAKMVAYSKTTVRSNGSIDLLAFTQDATALASAQGLTVDQWLSQGPYPEGTLLAKVEIICPLTH